MFVQISMRAQRLINKGMPRRAAEMYRQAAFDFTNGFNDEQRARLCERAEQLDRQAPEPKVKTTSYIREVVIEKALIAAVKARRGLCLKFTSPGRVNVPDRICIMPGGRIFFVECKAPGQKLRSGQAREAARLRALGCECYTLDSTDCDFLFAS